MAKVFISYSKKDYIGENGAPLPGNFIDRILKTLSDNGIDFWIDRKGLDPGVQYAEIIAHNIKECDTFLFLSTQNANTSQWTLREISTAIEFGKTVLPVRFDHSNYADAVALYLSSIQYIDWQELGEAESLQRMVACIKGDSGAVSRPVTKKLPGVTKGILSAGLVFLSACYAILTYQFLWAGSLRSSEIMGGLSGYVCEFGLLSSAWYLFRILRLRKCLFAFPTVVCLLVILAGMLIADKDVLMCGFLLIAGWLFVLAACFVGRQRRFFKLMNKDQTLLKPTDPENLLFIYLIFKALIIVSAHYFQLTGMSVVSFFR